MRNPCKFDKKSPTSTEHNLKIVQTNLNGIESKKNEVELLLHDINPDIFCVSESHLSEENSQIVRFDGYNSYHFCRKKKTHGGSAIYVKNSFSCSERTDMYDLCNESIFELAAVDVNLGSEPITVCNIYRTPPKGSAVFSEFLDSFESLCSRICKSRKIFIAGDFNIDLNKNDYAKNLFLDIAGSSGLVCCNMKPTRGDAILDNILVRENDMESGCISVELIPADISDHHNIILLEMPFPSKPQPTSNLTGIRTKINYYHLLSHVSKADFSPLFSIYDPNEKTNRLVNFIVESVNKCSTVKQTSREKNKKSWINQAAIERSRFKNNFYGELLQDPDNEQLKSAYKQIVKENKAFNRKTKIEFQRSRLKNCNGNASKIWKLVKEDFNMNGSVAPSRLKLNNQIVTDSSTIAKTFEDSFKQVWSSIHEQQAALPNPALLGDRSGVTFEPEPTTSAEVLKIIQSLDCKKAKGLDSISVRTVKEVGSYIAAPFADLFNSSLLQGIFPDQFKLGKITAVHKKGSRLDVNNYRPVTVLPVLSKIIEKIMFTRLNNFLNEQNSISCKQFGFREGKSTNDAILNFLSTIFSDLESGKVPIGICFDLTRAFDSINHDLLIQKLHFLGVDGNNLKWFQSYLKDRPNQFVLRDGNGLEIVSKKFLVNVGVPQGSILGPLLFLIYINDLVDVFSNDVHPTLFADDANVTFSVSNTSEIESKIEEVEHTFESWTTINKLTVNKSKTTIQIFKGERSISNSTKFLGVHIDDKLKFDVHVDEVCKKLRGAIYCLKNVRDWAGIPLLRSIYFALFHSHLSYCVLSWGNLPDFQILRIVRLQKWALRIMCRKNSRDSCRNLFSDLKIMSFPSFYLFVATCYAKKELEAGRFITRSDVCNHSTRNQSDIYYDGVKTQWSQKSVLNSSKYYYNKLPDEFKLLPAPRFESAVKKFFQRNVYYSFKEYNNTELPL